MIAQPQSMYGPRLTRPVRPVPRRAQYRAPDRRLRFLLGISAVTVSILAMSFLLPDATRQATAGTAPLTVWGIVTDLNGLPIEGAAVSIAIVQTGATRSVTTESDGLYSNSADEFSPSDYSVGDTIRVTVTYQSIEGTNTTVIDDEIDSTGLAQVDVRLSIEIPEFGSIGIPFAILSALAVFTVISRSSGRRRR